VEIGIIILVAVSLILNIVCLFFMLRGKENNGMSVEDKEELKNSFSNNVNIISDSLTKSNDKSAEVMQVRLDAMKELEKNSLDNMNAQIIQMKKDQVEEFARIKQTLDESMKNLQEKNEKKLSEIQSVVDEKLSKTLNERFKDSFTLLSTQLEKVTKTIGEMQNISNDVGNLTKMLQGVKTAGIFGEIQLGAIIEQILSPEQYVTNVVTKEFGKEPVEYAIKLPGTGNESVLLPVDSKFPYTVYSDMQNAYINNDVTEFESKKKQLSQTIFGMAKDINEKYISPPNTTNFAIMFLPIEGLYSEVVKMGLVEQIQSKYNVTIAGPTTMAALLNSLQMGFRTLAIQKKSNEVWTILGAVKNEFTKFEQILTNIQKKLNTANGDLDELIGTRTRAITRKLRDVEQVTNGSDEIIGINSSTDYDER